MKTSTISVPRKRYGLPDAMHEMRNNFLIIDTILVAYLGVSGLTSLVRNAIETYQRNQRAAECLPRDLIEANPSRPYGVSPRVEGFPKDYFLSCERR